jgi:pimeloyl-ACP methyl ester carboxylesterase
VAERRTLTRDGLKLSYVEAGAGDPALLFVHGWTCAATQWHAQIDEFSKRHRVVAVDLRGHGESDKPDEDYTIAQFADDVLWEMGELGLDRPVYVGHSMGGVIGVEVLRRAPGSVRAAVFVDAPVAPLPEEDQPEIEALLEGLRTPAYREVATEFISTAMFTEECDDGLRREITGSMAATPQRVMATALADTFRPENLWEGPWPVPALYVQAATMPFTPEQIRARFPGIEHESIECGHFIQMERPAQLNEKIGKFLERVR